MRINRSIVALVGLALLLGAGPKQEVTVQIRNLAFSPETVKVKVGDTVTWTNSDDRDHNATGDGISSGNIKPGKSWSKTFAKAGKYSYSCTLHPRMRGAVIVSE